MKEALFIHFSKLLNYSPKMSESHEIALKSDLGITLINFMNTLPSRENDHSGLSPSIEIEAIALNSLIQSSLKIFHALKNIDTK